MTNYESLKGYYIHRGFLGSTYRHVCKKCGTFITFKRQLRSFWKGKKYHLNMPYCEKCEKFKNSNGMKLDDEIYKPYG